MDEGGVYPEGPIASCCGWPAQAQCACMAHFQKTREGDMSVSYCFRVLLRSVYTSGT